MNKRIVRKLDCSGMLWPLAVVVMTVVVPTAQTQAVPQWQTAAGGKKAFDVASVRQNKSNDKPRSNVPLTEGTSYYSNGGVFLQPVNPSWPTSCSHTR
jgi:hypothetical protein